MKYDYGDDVICRVRDASGTVAEKAGCIVGITSVDTATFGYPTGTILYTVEFGDGSDALIPEGEVTASTDVNRREP